MTGFRETLLCLFKTVQRRGRLKAAQALRLPLVAVDQSGDSDSGRPTAAVIPDKARFVAEFFQSALQSSLNVYRPPVRSRLDLQVETDIK